MAIPRIIVNAKTYPQVTGAGVLDLARQLSDAAEEAGIQVGLAPPLVELSTLGRRDDLPGLHIYAQHVDPLEPGAGTGHVTVEAARAAGAVGTLLNHAERKVGPAVAPTVERIHAAGLQSLLCADSMEEVRTLSALHPTFVAVEPPELIGGDVSVTSADPAIVRDAAQVVRKLSPETLPLCGAGVKDGRDVAAALELGAYGVLLASGVVKAPAPGDALRELAAGLP